MAGTAGTVVVWFRRDLRLRDHGAMAAAGGRAIVPLFVLDPALERRAAGPRLQRLAASLAALDLELRGAGAARLVVRGGPPAQVVPDVAAQADADEVLVSGDYAPYGLRRDRAVASELDSAGRRLRAADSPYLHAPGTVVKGNGDPFAVFTPFFRAWRGLPVPGPIPVQPDTLRFQPPGEVLPREGLPDSDWAGPAGAAAAEEQLATFDGDRLRHYDSDHHRPDRPGTSRLSAALHFGEIHPRRILAAVSDHDGAAAFVRQLCWREFYADVLYRRPHAAWHNVDQRFDALPWRQDGDTGRVFDAWCRGATGYPFVDAGMRQLLTEGWMHNRVRLVTASFLTKDLMIDWRRGADWFLRHLVDGDVANNNLGWQWVAGTGMDPAPYHRVFNPLMQGLRFDPDGEYVRRYVPELRGLPGAAVHEPWQLPGGMPGYPPPIVDHAQARRDALAAYDAIRG